MSDFNREQFEKWFDESGFYKFKETAWAAWEASRECLMIELPADAHLSRDGLDEHYLAGDMRDQIVESIHAAGVKTK